MSPEDVYDDRERMSYMSTSMLNRDRQYQYQQQQQHTHYQPQAQQEYVQQTMSRSVHGQMLPPPAPASRHTSNTSSNLTNGTTASSASENWETYSDASEMEPEKDARDAYYSKIQTQPSENAGKRAAGGYGPMAPPPAKMRMHAAQMYGHDVRAAEPDENRLRVDGSESAWSTENEETY
jgi:Ase1/PRC1/MAP65 family protein